MEDIIRETREWYRQYNSRFGRERNDLLRNPGMLFQEMAYDACVIRAIRATGVNPRETSVLEVGCGGGASLHNFMRLGFVPEKLHGVDILEERIHDANKRYPNIEFRREDASRLSYQDASFDLVFESTMFTTLPDDELAGRIASEIIRVTRSGGWILLCDWRYDKPGHPEYRALSKSRLARLFGKKGTCRQVTLTHGALVPPLGRFLSAWAPSIYFLVSGVFPFLVGQVTVVLRKSD